MSQEDKPCSQHPDAPHGFDRNASHNAGRYVCECEGWEPVAAQEPETENFVQTVPDHSDRIVWKGMYIHLPIANAAPCARCAELERLRETNCKLNRRTQKAESFANAKIETAKEVNGYFLGSANQYFVQQLSDRIKALEAEVEQRESYREDMFSIGAYAAELRTTIERQRRVIELCEEGLRQWHVPENRYAALAAIAELEKDK